MLDYSNVKYFPSAKELPDSDDTPTDNELQDHIPTLLKTILLWLWRDRYDWFFGIDMGLYYHPDEPVIIPDAFLSLGVERYIDEDLRLSYVLWEEKVVPPLILEVVSQHYRGEFSAKKEKYAEIGALYYVIYAPRRRRKARLEVYKLVNGTYELQPGNPVWMPEIGLGIGAERGDYGGIVREWLYWYDEAGQRFPTTEERVQQREQQAVEATRRALEAEKRAQQLAERLRALGIDPETLD
ncbi:MAG: Uma2 family endonuclease [Cyanobacteriota bacterium]|nr:Uma2 family endonuclease [Cyanobacteriota bacterium]